MSEPRAEGPALVWAGENGAPVVLVLDPLGEAKHEEIPPTWNEIAGDRHVCWCRLPVEGGLTEAEELLADPAALGSPVDLVVSGPNAFEGLDMAARHTGTVRSVLLVDPESHSLHDGENRMSTRRSELEDAGIMVAVVARTFEGDRDRIGPPLPLGHPDVVKEVHSSLIALDAPSRGGV
ncbi:hypothetical protein [Prauserella flavalba]|uniref:Uncharacterized protein n=1 Tax=Prauserella flavalba TaxID=1477506 RepID=A0A318LHM4_9PSEU|nr:hypothetical protein [Prauserella flavalba]PXY28872.1 hypothetical protein BA062_22745 [Prauserella flavalba]